MTRVIGKRGDSKLGGDSNSTIYNVPTTKGKNLIFFGNYEWRKKETINNDQIQVWGCPKKTCPARAHAPIGDVVHLVVKTDHNHLPSRTKHIVRERKEQLKQQARENTVLPPRELISASREQLTDEQLISMPSYSSSKRTIERQRIVPERLQVDVQNPLEIVLGFLMDF